MSEVAFNRGLAGVVKFLTCDNTYKMQQVMLFWNVEFCIKFVLCL